MTDNTQSSSKFVIWGIRQYFMVMVIILLPLLSARLVMTPLFLQFEYHRPDFPNDIYGFTREDRLYYAPYALDYLLNDADISYLGNLTFPNSTRPLFNLRELRHMEDVKIVTRGAFWILTIGIITTLAIGLLAWRTVDTRNAMRNGIFVGAISIITIILTIVIMTIIAWDTFFTLFHTLLFESGTWQFLYSDTLIRLFPEKFWFDAALSIGAITTVLAIILLAITRRYR
jgi:integral membrane protein (TIGR01906 family)